MKTKIIQIISEWESFQSDGSDHPWNKDCPAKGRLEHFAGKMVNRLNEQKSVEETRKELIKDYQNKER